MHQRLIVRTVRIAAPIALIAALLPDVASGQSLGDVARKEEARRKTVKATGKVYTNDSLLGADAGAPPVPAPSAVAPAPPAKAQEGDANAPPDPKKTEAYWRERVARARQGLERAKMFQEALQSRINGLATDFAARDDPAQRQTVANDRQKALAEFERVKKEIADYEKELVDIEDEARKAGVPPGWVR